MVTNTHWHSQARGTMRWSQGLGRSLNTASLSWPLTAEETGLAVIRSASKHLREVSEERMCVNTWAKHNKFGSVSLRLLHSFASCTSGTDSDFLASDYLSSQRISNTFVFWGDVRTHILFICHVSVSLLVLKILVVCNPQSLYSMMPSCSM